MRGWHGTALPVVGGERGDERRQIRGVLLHMMKLTGVTDEGKKVFLRRTSCGEMRYAAHLHAAGLHATELHCGFVKQGIVTRPAKQGKCKNS